MNSWAWAAVAASIDPLQRDVGAPVGDVVAHRVVEEHGLLRDQADLPAQRVAA